MKKVVACLTVLGLSLATLLPLNAANNGIKIESENAGVKTLSEEGATILNTINTATSDLANGEVNIDIIIDNSKSTDIMYVLDNGSAVSSFKDNLIDTIKSGAKTLEGKENVRQGVVSTNDTGTDSVSPDSENIEMQLENVKNSAIGTSDGKIFDSIDKAYEILSASDAKNKVLVVFVSSLGSADANTLKTKIDGYAKDCNIIVYGIDMSSDTSNFNTIFGSAKVKNTITNGQIASSLNFVDTISTYFNKSLDTIQTNISFDNYILNNFDIKNVQASQGSANFNKDTNLVEWTVGNVLGNEKAILTYTLSVKDTVDSTIVDKLTLKTNRQIVVTKDGTRIGNYPEDSKIDDQICSPTIKILSSVNNPKTGIVNYKTVGIAMLIIASCGLAIVCRKKTF